MYHPDLAPTGIWHKDSATYAIGWLESGHEFTTGECHNDFIERLFNLCQHPTELCLGHHVCDFCPPAGAREYRWRDGTTFRTSQFCVQRNGEDVFLGSGELLVPGLNGKSYLAPNLIIHYVMDHSYKPPEEFIDAVLQMSILSKTDGNRHINDPGQNKGLLSWFRRVFQMHSTSV